MNIKIFMGMIISILFLTGCGTNLQQTTKDDNVIPSTNSTPPQQQMVGNDRDEHGCIGSAGYTWDEKQQKCVRPWEQ